MRGKVISRYSLPRWRFDRIGSPRSDLIAVLVIGLAMLLSGPWLAAGAGQQQGPQDLPGAVVSGIAPSAIAQIEAIQAEKAARTPTERKMNSQLINAQKIARGQAVAASVQALNIALPYTSDGRVEIDVRANVSADLLARLSALGAEVVETDATYRSVQIRVDLNQVEAIAALSDVLFVLPKQKGITSAWSGTVPVSSIDRGREIRRRTLQKRLERAALIAQVQRALGAQGPVTNVGSQQSQGDTTHKASSARSTYGVDGTGVKVGVLSDGVEHLSSSQALGDLGTVTVLSGQSGAGLCSPDFCDEGTAMLEIIHDLAPGAQLYFATASNSITSFAKNIRDLRTAGCDIIVDDVSYFDESAFQDGQTGAVVSTYNAGVVTQAVKDVAAAGALYFSSASNSGNLDAGTSGTFEGDFVSGGSVTFPESGLIHSFGGKNYNVVTSSSAGRNTISLDWSDPLGASSNDYDLFLLDSTGSSVVAYSDNVQTGTQDPHEILQVNGSITNDRIVIVKYSGTARLLHLNTYRGRMSIVTSGETHAHAATSASNSFGVAATPAAADDSFGGTPGPYPSPFNSGNKVEPFSSDGPRRIFFNGDGSAITPGNFSSNGGQVLKKPDMTAADGVTVSGVGNFGSSASSCGAVSGKCFYGTSAAAPHAAAIAALVKSANLSLTATQIRTALVNSAIDIATGAGWDRDSGVGIIMADAAVGSVGVAAATAPTVTTGSASSITTTSATVSATVNPNGANTTLYFDYGSTTSYGSTATYGTLSSGTATLTQSSTLTGLTCGTTYQYRARAQNSAGTTNGANQSFATSACVVATPLPASSRVNRDFNGDGKADILWRDTTTGTVAIWLMNGASIATNAAVGLAAANWTIAGVGDFDGDGKADIVLRDTTTGTVAIWLMNGVSIASNVAVGLVAPNWTIAGVGDFNGDGKADIVWRDTTTGTVAIWLMNGVSIASNVAVGLVAPNWTIAGVGNFDADGKADIVWRDTSAGTVAIWLMNGASIATNVAVKVMSTNWTIAEVGDFNGDGKADILWRDTNVGTVTIWLMNGVSIASDDTVAAVPTSWTTQ